MPFDVEAHYFTLLEDPARHEALRTICCFDLLANSADRKGGHCLAGDDGRVWAVDNGLTFHGEPKLRTVIWDFGGEPRARRRCSRMRCGWPTRAARRRSATCSAPTSAARCSSGRPRWRSPGRFPVDHTGRRYPWPLV